jgi:hypothetical protein
MGDLLDFTGDVDENVKSIATRADGLRRYLRSRHLPIDEFDYKDKVTQVESKVTMKSNDLPHRFILTIIYTYPSLL